MGDKQKRNLSRQSTNIRFAFTSFLSTISHLSFDKVVETGIGISMEKITNDHLIKEIGFVPLSFEGEFAIGNGYDLDYYETKLFNHGKVKIAGYIGKRVIIDTRDLDFIPFAYIYTYYERMNEDVRKKIWAEDARRTEEARRIREEREEKISTPGNRVYVSQVYGREGFRPSNGTVVSRQNGYAKVKLDYGIEVEVPFSMLSEPRQNPRLLTLKGELNLLYGRLECRSQIPGGASEEAIQKRIDRTIAEIKKLEGEEV